jgi:hypothetical protein
LRVDSSNSERLKDSRRLFVRSRCSVFSIIIFVSLVAAHAETLKGGPMLNCSGLPCVDLVIPDGKHLRMLIDTGNVNSMLDAAVAKAMGLELTPVSGGDGKPIPGYQRSVLTDARLGDASLGDVRVLVADIASYVKKDQMPAADGTLSYTAFKNRLLQLDYKKQTVLVSEPLTQNVPCPGFCGEITTPTFGKHGPPIVVSTGFKVNGQPLTVQLDTLFSGTMLVYPSSIGKLGLVKESESQRKQFFRYTDGGVNMMESEAATESFGSKVLARKVPVFFATDEVHQPDAMFDGTVGHGLFKGRVLTLDFHSNHAWLL